MLTSLMATQLSLSMLVTHKTYTTEGADMMMSVPLVVLIAPTMLTASWVMMKTALNYMCNGWDELCNYRNDGHYTIDNMVAERAIRPFTVKRKGSMSFSSEKGVKNTMIFHTIIETCFCDDCWYLSPAITQPSIYK